MTTDLAHSKHPPKDDRLVERGDRLLSGSHAYVTCSSSNCEDLDMMPGIDRGSDGVCGDSFGFNQGIACSGEVTWEQARDFCEGPGARLCTEYELEQNEAKASGCGADKALIWTSTPCGADSFRVEFGSSSGGDADICADVRFYFVCASRRIFN